MVDGQLYKQSFESDLKKAGIESLDRLSFSDVMLVMFYLYGKGHIDHRFILDVEKRMCQRTDAQFYALDFTPSGDNSFVIVVKRIVANDIVTFD